MDAQQPSTSGANTVKLAGALSGVVQLASSAPTVAELRAEAARLAGCAPECIKLICGGKTLQVTTRRTCDWGLPPEALAGTRTQVRPQGAARHAHITPRHLPPPQDDSKMLSDYGVTPTSRVLVTKGAGAAAALGAAAAAQQQQAAREARLEKLKSGAALCGGGVRTRSARGFEDTRVTSVTPCKQRCGFSTVQLACLSSRRLPERFPEAPVTHTPAVVEKLSGRGDGRGLTGGSDSDTQYGWCLIP